MDQYCCNANEHLCRPSPQSIAQFYKIILITLIFMCKKERCEVSKQTVVGGRTDYSHPVRSLKVGLHHLVVFPIAECQGANQWGPHPVTMATWT